MPNVYVDGVGSITFPDTMSPADIQEVLVKNFPKTINPVPENDESKTGFIPAIKSSYEKLKGESALTLGKIGIMDVDKAEAYNKEKEELAKNTFVETKKGWTEAPLTKIGELAGQSLPYVAAPLVAAGAVVGTAALAPELMAGAGLATAGAGLTNLGLGVTAADIASGAAGISQFVGSNLSRQMDTGKSLEETSLLAAGAAAIPQGMLDVFGLKMIPGVKRIFGDAGIKIADKTAEQVAKTGLMANAAKFAYQTGKVAGAEGLTEAGQQVFERLQAGLSITDENARKEYFDNFIGGAVLGTLFGTAGRVLEKTAPNKLQSTEISPPPITNFPITNLPTQEETVAHEVKQDTHENPYGNVHENDMSEDLSAIMLQDRIDNNKPILKSYSLEDIADGSPARDAMKVSSRSLNSASSGRWASTH